MTPLASISVDWLVIARLAGAMVWGFALSIFLYQAQRGIELRRDHTWVSVVIGIGMDLLLSFPEGWFVTAWVIACSSVGVIGFAVFYREPAVHGYNAIGHIEDATAHCLHLIELLEEGLDKCGQYPDAAKHISLSLKVCHKAHRALLMARNGDLIEKARKR